MYAGDNDDFFLIILLKAIDLVMLDNTQVGSVKNS